MGKSIKQKQDELDQLNHFIESLATEAERQKHEAENFHALIEELSTIQQVRGRKHLVKNLWYKLRLSATEATLNRVVLLTYASELKQIVEDKRLEGNDE